MAARNAIDQRDIGPAFSAQVSILNDNKCIYKCKMSFIEHLQCWGHL